MKTVWNFLKDERGLETAGVGLAARDRRVGRDGGRLMARPAIQAYLRGDDARIGRKPSA